MSHARRAGMTLVEVLVALALLAINLAGWSATIHLIAVLLQRTAQLVATLEPPELVGLCSLGWLVARPPTAARSEPARWFEGGRCPRAWRARCGLSLVEVLIALALSSLVFTLVAGGVVSSTRFTRSALERGDALDVKMALPAMLQQVIAAAGRGVTEACALAVDPSRVRLSVTHAAPGGTLVVDEVFAALDGGGRPALYLRRVPHVRQPWLEDVTAFQVLAVELDDDERVAAVVVTIDHLALSDPLVVRASLPHRPCLEAVP